MMKPVIRLPLEKAYNVRELGGYPTTGGHTTAYQQLLRADDLHELTEKDQVYMKQYGVKTIIDLRGASELAVAPNPFAIDEDMEYINIPLIQEDVGAPHMAEQLQLADDEFLSNMYVSLLQRSTAEVKAVFEIIAKSEGVTVFHCSAGKDRTGVIAMLLLGLVNVERSDLIANYMVTEVYLREKLASFTLDNGMPASLLQSQPAFIESAIDYIIENYHSFRNYLLHIGIAEETLNAIEQKLLQTEQLKLFL